MKTQKEIINILERHETTSYPNGVGSISRSVFPSSYKSIAQEIAPEKPLTAQELYNMADKWVNTFNFIQLSVYEKMCDNMLFEYIESEEIDFEDFVNDYQLHDELLQHIQDSFDDVDEGTDLFSEELFENEIEYFCTNHENFEDYRSDREGENYPMWNTLFEFKSEPSEEVKEAAKKCGFGIISGMDDLNTTLFASGCGYSFYGAHWIPLFLELPWNSNLKERAKGIDYSMM